jgi:formylglycine-generating enzyme required for sulfatase activity/tRNA A-37 threonylcarbamoyl transferase component Bud32/dienelactone hydrolase
MIGQTLGHYRIEAKLGEGGMGVVYKARDTRLDRLVALKLLPPEIAQPERKRRFLQEAKAASALNHPNIVTVHDVLAEGRTEFIVMEYVQGQTLGQLIGPKGLGLNETLNYATQMADALAAAHRAGIIHRDLKPANVMVTEQGLVKVLDFGLAKLTEPGPERGPTGELAETKTVKAGEPPLTEAGTILGTVAYMSPEQVEGKKVDARSDIFSFGAVLYEMVTGRRAFQGDSRISTMSAILRDTPAPVKTVRPDVPAELSRILFRCLEKNREARYASGSELHQDLVACQARLAPVSLGAILRRPRFAVPATLLLVAVVALGGWLWVRSSRVRWAREVALPEIARLIDKGSYYNAFHLARQVQSYVPGDPQLEALWRDTSLQVSIRTTPPGAEVYMREYFSLESPPRWRLVGTSPIHTIRVPAGYVRWRVTKPGFDSFEGASPGWGWMPSFTLPAQGTTPPGMVHVPGGSYQFGSLAPVQLQDYWLDKYEVTNRRFKEFVGAGGYQKRQYWEHPFVKDGKVLTWEQAVAEFRDSTGRTGPSTWELGTYREGQADFPVSGVSWYEAAAYAEFAGKSLPTIYHWYNAVGPLHMFADIVKLSNFGGAGPSRVGNHQGLGPYGTYDMAGNVKEWCWNQSASYRYILGGAWGEPEYLFGEPNRMPPFDRSATHGFRCAKYTAPLAETLAAPVQTPYRDFTKEKPVSDEIFQFYKSIYAYDRGELKAAVESVDDSSEHWRKEKVAFNAAYGNERVIAYLFLPKNASPPYQTVVFFPGLWAVRLKSSEDLRMEFLDFVIRSGRALLHPVYKGTYERQASAAADGPNFVRDRGIQWSKDLGRSIDYLETRPDIDRDKLAYYGLSMGGAWGPILTATEGRFKASVLLAGGLLLGRQPPESEAIHFAPRVRMPVLMLNGRHDYAFPLEISQKPMFRLLGTPEKDKRHVIYDSGHIPPRNAVIKEILDWLDRYLGPVKMKP